MLHSQMTILVQLVLRIRIKNAGNAVRICLLISKFHKLSHATLFFAINAVYILANLCQKFLFVKFFIYLSCASFYYMNIHSYIQPYYSITLPHVNIRSTMSIFLVAMTEKQQKSNFLLLFLNHTTLYGTPSQFILLSFHIKCAHSGIYCAFPKLLFNTEQLVIFCHTFGTAGCTGLDLTSI